MTDPKGLSSLEKLVSYEIKNRQHLDPNSATQALLWLTRSVCISICVSICVGVYWYVSICNRILLIPSV